MTTTVAERIFNASMIFVLALSIALVSTTPAAAQSVSPVYLNPGQTATITITLTTPDSGVAKIEYKVQFTPNGSVITSRKECIGTTTRCFWRNDNAYPRWFNYICDYGKYERCLRVHLNPQVKAYKLPEDEVLTITFPANGVTVTVQ